MHYMLADKYPIETPEQVKLAAGFVEDHLSRFEPAQRVAMAFNLEKRASQLGVVVEKPWVSNYSRFLKSASYSPEFSQAMECRAQACGDTVVGIGENQARAADLYNCLSKSASNVDPVDMASVIAELDKVAGLDTDYDVRIEDPVFLVCGSHTDPFYDHPKVAGHLTELAFKAELTKTACRDKVVAVLGQDNFAKLAKAPLEFFSKNPAIKEPVLKAAGIDV